MESTIPFIRLATTEKESVLDEIFAEIRQMFKSSQFILGDRVGQFETAYAQISGCEFGIGVNSGLDALILGLRALGVGPGDEVITAPNSFVASASAISLVGATPVFADVSEDYNIDPAAVERAITPRTRAVLPVHLTGNPCQMNRISEICEKHSLKIIEDAAQAVGASIDGRSVGSLGDIGAFSLHPLKNLHVWGDGGMITTRHRVLADQLRLQRNHGLVNRNEVEFFSYNSRLDTLQAIVGLAYLKMLDQVTEKRRANARIYDDRLKEVAAFIIPPPNPPAGVKHVYHVYQVRAQRRGELISFLQNKGIETKIHYPIPIHWQKAAAHLGYQKGDFPVTDKLAEEIVSLPVREDLAAAEVHRVCDTIKEFYTH